MVVFKLLEKLSFVSPKDGAAEIWGRVTDVRFGHPGIHRWFWGECQNLSLKNITLYHLFFLTERIRKIRKIKGELEEKKSAKTQNQQKLGSGWQWHTVTFTHVGLWNSVGVFNLLERHVCVCVCHMLLFFCVYMFGACLNPITVSR